MIIFPNSAKLVLRQSLFDLDKCMKANINENESEAAGEKHGATPSMRQKDRQKREKRSLHSAFSFEEERRHHKTRNHYQPLGCCQSAAA